MDSINMPTVLTSEKHILVVDDNPADILFLKKILRDQGYLVHSTVEAENALEFVKYMAPDLILLDVKMPGMNGYQLCDQLKSAENTCNTPIIFISGGDQVVDKVMAFSKGGVDYILKPYQTAEVLARIRLHLSLHDLQKGLEERVRERTAELTQAIASLQDEINARKQAEDELRSHRDHLQEEVDARKRAESELIKHRDHLEELVGERTAQLVTEKRRAEAANDAKSAFLTNMSHELRTPLNCILGYAQILQQQEIPRDRQVTGLQAIQQSGEHLLTLINDILDLAKIEANKVTLYPAPVNLTNFLRGVAEIIRVKVEEKNLRFIFEASPNMPRAVMIEEKRLRQVLLNLLGNAAKFTDKGDVRLRVKGELQPDATINLRFEVEDTGVGIHEEHLGSLFEPFEQVGDLRRRSGGTGLGLAISRQLIGLMGADIAVRSKLGEGTLFWFELSLPICDMGAPLSVSAMAESEYRGVNVFPKKPIDQEAVLGHIHQHVRLSKEITQSRDLAQSETETAAFLVAPPPKELALLHRLALAGNMRDIREWAINIETVDIRYHSFGRKLRRLAANYQSQAILDFVEDYCCDSEGQ